MFRPVSGHSQVLDEHTKQDICMLVIVWIQKIKMNLISEESVECKVVVFGQIIIVSAMLLQKHKGMTHMTFI
jgi:hypothetical protein